MHRAYDRQDELVEAYIADLESDIAVSREAGQREYADRCQAEIDALRSGTAIVLDRSGIPTTDPAAVLAVEMECLRLIHACLTIEPAGRDGDGAPRQLDMFRDAA